MIKKIIYCTVLVLSTHLFYSQSGNVGIGTTDPTERLDVANGNVRVRDINSNVASGSYNMVAADANGVLKITPGVGFSTSNSGNKMLDARGGSQWVYGTNWQNNQYWTVPLNEVYDPQNAYNPSTGIFTAPQDGLYYITNFFRLNTDGTGAFDGVFGNYTTYIFIDGNTTPSSVGSGSLLTGTSSKVYRGSTNPGGTYNYDNFCTALAWLKAGQTIRAVINTYGTGNMTSTPAGVTLDRGNSNFQVYKVL